ncbi:MAG: sigma-54-dependent Fis family transcriptional regulator, partial [Gemmatimonadetes bacterium]|nr:sigma-54-dependent Fis family transcriptional regulator [Gemmatimonadota bacterium]
IDIEHLPSGMEAHNSQVSLPQGDVDFDQELERFERHLILHAYEQCNHVKAATARTLGIDRNRLRYKLEKFGIG